MTLTIRLAEEADAEAYEVFMSRIFAENLDTLVPRGLIPALDKVRYFISNHCGQRSALFLAEKSDRIVGAVSLTRQGRPQRDHAALLGLNVAFSHRGQGIGRTLLQQGLAWAALAPDLFRVELEVMANNSQAIALYESAGFVREGTKRNAVRKSGQFFDVHSYGLLLPPP